MKKKINKSNEIYNNILKNNMSMTDINIRKDITKNKRIVDLKEQQKRKLKDNLLFEGGKVEKKKKRKRKYKNKKR